MPSTIVATPKAANANSYVTKNEADVYFENRLYASTWTSAATPDCERSLIMATKHIDYVCDWDVYMAGRRTTLTQALQWPRSGALTRDADDVVDQDTVPEFVKDFTCEVALAYLTKDRTVDPTTRGITSVKAGPVAVTFDKAIAAVQRLLPDTAWQIIEPWVENPFPGSPNMLRVVELVR